MHRTFISHSSRNNAQALAIAEWLAEEGHQDLFLDIDPERGLLPSQKWHDEFLRRALVSEAV